MKICYKESLVMKKIKLFGGCRIYIVPEKKIFQIFKILRILYIFLELEQREILSYNKENYS